MQDADLFPFMAIFRQLLGVFPKRGDEADIQTLSKAYFTALRRHSIEELQAGADVWLQRGKFFPKPAEWSAAIPRLAEGTVSLSPLSAQEAAEYLDAERRGWQGEPCGCRRCKGAGVDHRFPRYVPERDEHDRDLRGLIGERIVTRGRWIHGEDLRRWYEARDAFFALKDTILPSKDMPKVTKQETEPNPYRESA